MKYIYFISLLLLTSCLSYKVSPTTVDSNHMFYKDSNDVILLSSLNSAEQIKIIRLDYYYDTLLVTYKAGLFVKPKCKLPLHDSITYLKCANKVYLVRRSENGFELDEIINR